MKKFLDGFMAVILICSIIVFSFYHCVEWKDLKYQRMIQETARNRKIAENKNFDTIQEVYQSPIDFTELQLMNPDIAAWITIPGTDIDMPIVQGIDNEKYCSTDFSGKKSSKGTIFLDFESQRDFLGQHSIIYGHHMKNGSMFAGIGQFREEKFFKSHRRIVLYTPDRELCLKTIAVVCTDDNAERRRTKFSSTRELQTYIEKETKSCPFRELPKGKQEQLYSFVTCSYEFSGARTILYAVIENQKGW